MLHIKTGEARFNGKGHECPLRPPEVTRLRGGVKMREVCGLTTFAMCLLGVYFDL